MDYIGIWCMIVNRYEEQRSISFHKNIRNTLRNTQFFSQIRTAGQNSAAE